MKVRIIIPGEVVSKDLNKPGENMELTDRGVVSTRLGVVQSNGKKTSIIPYSGPYKPRTGELVIGVIVGYAPNGWFVDIDAGIKAFLPASEAFRGRYDPRIHDLKNVLEVGDVIIAKVLSAERLGSPLLTLKSGRGLGKIKEAWFIKVPVVKIARIIGRRGSMLRILEEKTNSKITVGQNGVLAIEGSYIAYKRIKEAIKLISEKTFVRGLTEHVTKMLDELEAKG